MLGLSSSEELDIFSKDAGNIEDLPPLSPAYEKLLEVVTRAVNKLNIDWPVKKQEAQRKSTLNELFLQTRAQLSHCGLHFFPDLHTEVSRCSVKGHSHPVFPNLQFQIICRSWGRRRIAMGQCPGWKRF